MEATQALEPAQRVFVEDVHNLVLGACGDGVEAFFKCVAAAVTEAELSEDPAATDTHQLDAIFEGTQRIYDALANRCVNGMDLFSRICSTVFKPSLEVEPLKLPTVQLPAELASSGDEVVTESEEELTHQVESLRLQLSQVDHRCSQLQGELQRLDGQLRKCGVPATGDLNAGGLEGYESLSLAATSNRHSIQAIVQGAHRLQLLLEEASRVRAQREGSTSGALCGQSRILKMANTSADALAELASIVPEAPMSQ